ncbi:MAG TPA: FG-GAP-like repeat-containing protein [Opitutaceae bacterium]|nr:FG-GAP-like repeat-containing protein [Opitutaceae bacterium]
MPASSSAQTAHAAYDTLQAQPLRVPISSSAPKSLSTPTPRSQLSPTSPHTPTSQHTPTSPMFTAMPPEQTGIVTENKYADPAMWGDRNQEFKFGAIGTGIAIGDYDGDGLPDIFVVSKTEACRLFRNLGDWKFANVTAQAGLGAPSSFWEKGLAEVKSWIGSSNASNNDPAVWKQGATFVDINNDGKLDLYVCRFAAPNLLYINQGDGTFKESAHSYGLDISDASNMAAFADYDRDGWLDLFLQTNLLDATTHPAGQKNFLFHNNHDGTFSDVTQKAGIAGEAQGHSATWWDFDNDGWPDIYVANDFAPADVLYRNNHDGTFTNVIDRVVPHMPHSAMGADLGDVTNDGLIDLLVADMAATTHAKDQRGMANIRDLLNDPKNNAQTAPQYMRNALYLNTGAGRVLEAASLAGLDATDWTWSVRLEDLDNDGRLDAYFTNGMVRELHNVDLVRKMSGAESVAESVRILKASPALSENNLVYRSLGDMRFEDVSRAWGLDQNGVSFGAAFGDLDGDGDLDLVFANYEGGVTVLRNDCASGHRLVLALRGRQSNRFGVGAVVRIETAAGKQVRQLVLARGYLSNSEPVLHFGLGEESTIRKLEVFWPSGQRQIFENLAADKRYTVTEASDHDGNAGSPTSISDAPAEPTTYTEATAKFGLAFVPKVESRIEPAGQPLLPIGFERGSSLALGDLNADGRDDLVIGPAKGQPLRVGLRREDGGFDVAVVDWPERSKVADGGAVAILDVNGDGLNDIVVAKSGAELEGGNKGYQPTILLNDGRSGWKTETDAQAATRLTSIPISAGALAAADFDRDGQVDIFVGGRVTPGAYPVSPYSALLRNLGSKFENVTASLAPGLERVGMVTAALWCDVDRDGWPDLVLAIDWGTPKYFHNARGKGFEDWSERSGFARAGSGWWRSVATADFNGDGRPDFVFGNVGLNTTCHASPENPAAIFYGDFAGTGAPVLIEAESSGGKFYPKRTRKELGAKIPAILKRYPRNDLYAAATLNEIVGENRLAKASAWYATEFSSGVLLSKDDGAYEFLALPRIAQISSTEGVVTGDFDGDGHADIFAVQNTNAPIASVGHIDGGLSQLLLGDGHGSFRAVTATESGLIIPGETTAVVALRDVSHATREPAAAAPAFVVSRGDGSVLVFTRRK